MISLIQLSSIVEQKFHDVNVTWEAGRMYTSHVLFIACVDLIFKESASSLLLLHFNILCRSDVTVISSTIGKLLNIKESNGTILRYVLGPHERVEQ